MRTELDPVIQHHIANTLGWSELRPLQREAIEPIRRGDDVLLLAPTAGGKTEAAIFPLLSRMADENWQGLSTLYVCPLRALLNNLEPRLSFYCSWLGRRVAIRHGDTSAGNRRRVALDRPDILLTTPESLEAMLVSTLVSPRELFAELKAVVVDEVHSFAGDDRGWHLLAVLERLTRIAGRPLQRIGLSATVGNPEPLLWWLQGSGRDGRRCQVVAPGATALGIEADVQLDYVGNLANGATVIASLHRGEKRLVFADSRRTVESLAVNLRSLGVETFISHSSLSAAERHRAEQAFVEARDCVIVATSTLELGIDVGDLDRIIQVGAPGNVASFLQRLGRSGRRAGSARNMLFLAANDEELLRAAGLCLLWGEGYIEPVTPPSTPRHVLAQQLLALCLQEGQVGRRTWMEWLEGIRLAPLEEVGEITDWLVASGHLNEDSGMLFMGPSAERRFGRRHFLELLSVFTSDPQFVVLQGRKEIGTVDPTVLTRRVEGSRVLQLAGHSWVVTYIDWKRRQTFVEPTKAAGKSAWFGLPRPLSFELTDAMRRVLLGAEASGVMFSGRAASHLASVRNVASRTVDENATVLAAWDAGQVRWWTWGGAKANAVVAAALTDVDAGLVDAVDRYDNRYLKLRRDATEVSLGRAIREAQARFGPDLAGSHPTVSEESVKQLKFAELLPPRLAAMTLEDRAVDRIGAERIAARSLLYRE